MRCSVPERLAALAVAVLTAGCVAAPSGGYRAAEIRTAPDATVALRADGVERIVRQGTLRVRARGCVGVGSGSGFAIAERVLATNRHVVAGADVLQVSTWDGRSFDVAVSGVAVANDLAVVVVEGDLPQTLEPGEPPPAGAHVTAVGYPGGDAIDFAPGRVLDYLDGRPFEQRSTTMRVSSRVIPGNSGGPLVDAEGRVVGIVFALEVATGHGLAIPIDALVDDMQSDGFFENTPGC